MMLRFEATGSLTILPIWNMMWTMLDHHLFRSFQMGWTVCVSGLNPTYLIKTFSTISTGTTYDLRHKNCKKKNTEERKCILNRKIFNLIYNDGMTVINLVVVVLYCLNITMALQITTVLTISMNRYNRFHEHSLPSILTT